MYSMVPMLSFLFSWAPSLGVNAKFSTSKKKGTCGSTTNNQSHHGLETKTILYNLSTCIEVQITNWI